MAESCVPGAVVSEVARRWQISPQQLFTWRRQARAAAVTEAAAGLSFVPIVAEPLVPMPDASLASARPGPSLEVELAGAVLRVAPGTDAELLTAVLRALRASAA